MKIVYMGTPEFAVEPLKKLREAGHEILAVVTQPDRPRDRGKKVSRTPVATAAEAMGLSIHQPESLKRSQELAEEVKKRQPDVVVVVAYGQLLPSEWVDLPTFGCLNIHASLLPKYRGAAPIQHAILQGEEWTGVTLMYLSEGMDEGDILAARRTKIGKKTAGDLHEELSNLGSDLLVETLPEIQRGRIKAFPQDPKQATYAPMLKKEDGRLDFQRGAVELERQIRGMNPWPGAFTSIEGKTMKIWQASVGVEEQTSGGTPGRITEVGSAGMKVQTGKGILLLERIQMPGKKPLAVSDYIKGNQIEIGTILR